MSLALFRSELRTAVREAQDREPRAADRAHPRLAERFDARRVSVLERFARGEITLDQALSALGDRP